MAPKAVFRLEALPNSVGLIFDQVQTSITNHRKNCVKLYKLQLQAALITERDKTSMRRNAIKRTGEKAFVDVFHDMMSRILGIKKGSANAERVVKFIGAYVRFIIEKASEEPENQTSHASSSTPSNDNEETPGSRLIQQTLSYLLKGFNAKEKTVRFRTVSMVAELLSCMGELDEDMYEKLQGLLMERLQDKEAIIRAHSVIGLSKLVNTEEPTTAKEDEGSVMEVLLEELCCDPASDVRRAALVHIPVLLGTLPSILTRARDVDPLVRSYLFAVVLCVPPVHSDNTLSRCTNANRISAPLQLTTDQRIKVIKDGLGDREDRVRAAVGKTLGSWLEWIQAQYDARTRAHNVKTEPMDSNPIALVGALVDFVKLFDLAGRWNEEEQESATVSADAIRSIFLTKPHIVDMLVFTQQYWKALTPEKSLIARVYLEHITQLPSTKQSKLLESSSFPVLTAVAYYIQSSSNAAVDLTEQLVELRLEVESEIAEEEVLPIVQEKERALNETTFILGELLKLVSMSDFSDELGRKTLLHQVIRETLSLELLPEYVIPLYIDVLVKVITDEREMIRFGMAIINELREPAKPDSAVEEDQNQGISVAMTQSSASSSQTQSTASSSSTISRRIRRTEMVSPEEEARDVEIDARCLLICSEILKHIHGIFDEGFLLKGILSGLILPAVESTEPILRERGLLCLGLCCLISKDIAMSSFQLFMGQVQSAREGLKLKVLQVIFDILMMYDKELLHHSPEITEKIVMFLLGILEDEESPAVLALVCMGISKLMLNGHIADERILLGLVIAYVSPFTVDNQGLRQCLSYALPMYCYMSPTNQSRMQQVFMTAFDHVTNIYEGLEEDQDMITPLQFGVLFLDWTNPQKAASSRVTGVSARDVHVDLAIDILKALYEGRSESDQKILCQLLPKLYFPAKPERMSLYMIHLLLENFNPMKTVKDSPSVKLLDKFRARFRKQYSRIVDGVDARKYAGNVELQMVCKLVNVQLDFDEDEEGSSGGQHDQLWEDESEGEDSRQVEDPSALHLLIPRDSQRATVEAEDSEDEEVPAGRHVQRSVSRSPPASLRRPNKIQHTVRENDYESGPQTSDSETDDDDEPLPTPVSSHPGGEIPIPPGYRKRPRSPEGDDPQSPSRKKLNKGKEVVRNIGRTLSNEGLPVRGSGIHVRPHNAVGRRAEDSELEYEELGGDNDVVAHSIPQHVRRRINSTSASQA